ncbi:MAG: hypothetical protein ACK53L_18055, partial [Pirellulaceae bacterium]
EMNRHEAASGIRADIVIKHRLRSICSPDLCFRFWFRSTDAGAFPPKRIKVLSGMCPDAWTG